MAREERSPSPFPGGGNSIRSLPFSENVVIITGASAGIGRAVALELADQGAWLALAARNAERLEEVVARARDVGERSYLCAALATLSTWR